MCNACTPILVGMTSPVLEILVPSKRAKLPWSSKYLIYWNQLKKFTQVAVDIKCMHANFGGCGYFGFGDIATFKNGQISLFDHGL